MSGKLSSKAPKQIGIYTYDSLITLGQSNTLKGLYSDKQGKKFFVKISPDKNKMTDEYNNQKLFHNLLMQCNEQRLIIPTPIGIEVIENSYYAFVMEFIPNVTPLPESGINNKVETYLCILKFLSKYNSDKHPLKKLKASYQYATLPYFLIKNVLTYPANWKIIIKSHIQLIFKGIKWLNHPSSSLSQGDFNVTNIMLTSNKIVLFDFAEACLTHKYLNLAQALNSSWYDKDFQYQLWDKIIVEFNFNEKESQILKSFVLFNLMQRLCKRYKTTEQEDAYFNKIERLINEI